LRPCPSEFDRDRYIQESAKTAFAGPAVHARVTELLKTVAPLLGTPRVDDEGEYCETEDGQLLAAHMDQVRSIIDHESAKDRSAHSQVKNPEGRTLDVLS